MPRTQPTAAQPARLYISPALRALAVPLDQVVQLPGNPRRGDVVAIARSLAVFGQRKNVVVRASPDGPDGPLVCEAGNHTAQAAAVCRDLARPLYRAVYEGDAPGVDAALADIVETLGSGPAAANLENWCRAAINTSSDDVPFSWLAVSPEDEDSARALAYALADNRTAAMGTDDPGLLLAMLEAVREADEALISATAYMGEDLDALRLELEPGPAPLLGDPDDIPDPGPPVTRRGDVWLLGPHRLMCGDSTSADDMGRLMGADRAALLFADPPYGVSYSDKNRFLNTIAPCNRIQEPIEGDHLSEVDVQALWLGMFGTARSFMRPGGSYYVTGPQGGDLLLLLLALREAGFPLRHMLIWAKNNHVLGRSDYNYQHEPVIYGWVDGAAHRWFGDGSETSLWQIPRPRKSDLHPTMKPVGLVAHCLRNSSAPGDVVLDPCAGSGTTVVACAQTGRVGRVMEISPGYADVICRRFQGATGVVPVLEATGAGRDFLGVDGAG